jgi:predicted transporter
MNGLPTPTFVFSSLGCRMQHVRPRQFLVLLNILFRLLSILYYCEVNLLAVFFITFSRSNQLPLQSPATDEFELILQTKITGLGPSLA